jgi:hypothetical protein
MNNGKYMIYVRHHISGAGGWRQQHDEEFKNLYTVPNVIKG